MADIFFGPTVSTTQRHRQCWLSWKLLCVALGAARLTLDRSRMVKRPCTLWAMNYRNTFRSSPIVCARILNKTYYKHIRRSTVHAPTDILYSSLSLQGCPLRGTALEFLTLSHGPLNTSRILRDWTPCTGGDEFPHKPAILKQGARRESVGCGHSSVQHRS